MVMDSGLVAASTSIVEPFRNFSSWWGYDLMNNTTEPMILVESDIPGASLDGWDPSKLHVVELKRWLKCRGASLSGRKADLVKLKMLVSFHFSVSL